MADGPTHYREAERLAKAAEEALDLMADAEDESEHGHLLAHVQAGAALALVHQGLAHTAAQALSVCGTTVGAREAWLAVVQP